MKQTLLDRLRGIKRVDESLYYQNQDCIPMICFEAALRIEFLENALVEQGNELRGLSIKP